MNAGRLRTADPSDRANEASKLKVLTSGIRFRRLRVGNERLAQSVVQGQRRESKKNLQDRVIIIQISQHHDRQIIVGKVRQIRSRFMRSHRIGPQHQLANHSKRANVAP
jgi:hypothetical protein